MTQAERVILEDKIQRLKKRYEKACTDYVAMFCQKQDMEFGWWIADRIGEWAVFGDYSFTFSDIKFDVENQLPKGFILEWYDRMLENGSIGKSTCNYETYAKLNGPRYFREKRG